MQQFIENNPLWDYAIDLYSQQGVADKLLLMQNNYGLNVNVLITMCWLGKEGKAIHTEQLEALLNLIDVFDKAVIQNIRTARKALKDQEHASYDIYENIKALELDCEHLLIDQIFNFIKTLELKALDSDFSDQNVDIYCNIALNDQPIDAILKRFYRG